MWKMAQLTDQASSSFFHCFFLNLSMSQVIRKFRSGSCNVLVSTSVGEEGLDIGEVDLIICFDAQKSPLRSIQRTGRTGRKRAGKSIMLLTEGDEEERYRKCVANKGTVRKDMLRTDYQMYPHSPRMVPDTLHPLCVKLKLDPMPPYKETETGGTGNGRRKSSKGARQSWMTKRGLCWKHPRAPSFFQQVKSILHGIQSSLPWNPVSHGIQSNFYCPTCFSTVTQPGYQTFPWSEIFSDFFFHHFSWHIDVDYCYYLMKKYGEKNQKNQKINKTEKLKN